MKRIRKLTFIFVLALCSCSTVPTVDNTAARRTVVDGLGKTIQLPSKVERVVSLAPSITEMIFAAGAGEKLVGVTTYCDYPEQAKAIQKIGDTQTPNIESIIALKPQVVFVSTDSQLQSFANTLAQQNTAVFVLDIKQLDDVPSRLRLLGGIFGTEAEAERQAASFEQRTKRVAEKIGSNETVQVFVQISREPFFTIGHESFLTELIRRAGGISVTTDVPSAYPKLNKETAFALKPDVIILSDSEDNPEPNDALKDSPAVKNKRVFRIDADIISRPGPRLVDALEQISQFLREPPGR